MKKLITLLLAVAGMVSTASATDVTRRIFFFCNWNDWQTPRLYTYWSGGELTSFDNRPTMNEINEQRWFYYDVTTDENNFKTMKFIVTKPSSKGEGNQTIDIDAVDFTTSNYYFIVANDNNSRCVLNKTALKFYLYNTSSGSTEEMSTTDYINYSVADIDNQTTPSSSYYTIVPSFVDLSNANRWKLMYRPAYADKVLSFTELSNKSSNIDNGGDNSWNTNNVAAHFSLSLNTVTQKWSVNPYRTITIGTAGYATWSNDEKYMVSGDDVTAYTATDMGSYVRLNEKAASAVYPAGTGLVLEGSGDVTIKAVASDATTTDVSGNSLRGSGNNNASIAAGSYVLYWDGSKAGFKITNAGTIAAHKAYLPATGSARSFLGFNEEATGINEVNTIMDNGVIFNLQGVRMNKIQKGLNIVNGKKVMVK